MIAATTTTAATVYCRAQIATVLLDGNVSEASVFQSRGTARRAANSHIAVVGAGMLRAT